MHYIESAAADLNSELRKAFTAGLPLMMGTEPHLSGALWQVLEHPGSMVRARLVYEMSRAYGLTGEQATHLAIGIEYFHTASLLLDDLPCMDNATERRGEPCVHRTHGEAAALLAALGLVNRAYALVWRGLAEARLDRRTEAAAYVEKCLGVDGLLNGQSEDLHYPSLPDSRRSPIKIATGKTVSLIRLSLVLPALLGGASPSEIRLFERLASFWGLSYQILDDLKDILPQAVGTGKTAARDQSLNRPNLALAIGAVQSLRRVERLMVLGDQVLGRLLARLPAMNFLHDLRLRFEKEINALKTANAAANAAGA